MLSILLPGLVEQHFGGKNERGFRSWEVFSDCEALKGAKIQPKGKKQEIDKYFPKGCKPGGTGISAVGFHFR